MTPKLLRIATRGSQLAMWQAENVRDALIAVHPDLQVEVEIVRTTGDRILDVPLAKIGDRGLFTKEIDEALLEGRADIAVHSLKDVPTRVPDGLDLAAVTERADPRDVLIGPRGASLKLETLTVGARVGTSSLRRRSQLRHVRPDVEVVDLRGNLNTRLARLDDGGYDAIILAAAGVLRLGWTDRISHYLEPADWLPAVGQGALAIVARADDGAAADLLRPLHHPETAACVAAERSFLRTLEGGCQVPIGALATLSGDELRLDGLVADMEGERILRDLRTGPVGDAAALGERVAESLRSAGADEILRAIRAAADAPGIPGP
ncbi:MAG: hydroxymethylbilane synthase [Gemmatimonadota bacterium]